jgi:hypothetical protein
MFEILVRHSKISKGFFYICMFMRGLYCAIIVNISNDCLTSNILYPIPIIRTLPNLTDCHVILY